VDYYVSGPDCSGLTSDTLATLTRQLYASRDLLNLGTNAAFTCADRASDARDGQVMQACPPDAAVKQTSLRCQVNDLGVYLIPTWDAVTLADALLPDRPPAGRDYLTSLNATAVTLATGVQATVRDGRLSTPTIPVLMWHVDPVLDPSQVWERPSTDLLLPTDSATGTGSQAP
jgi:hypothetical protein